jgi:hypothetical protein
MGTETPRQRAEHLRRLARDLTDEPMQKRLLDLAKEYDHTAEAMERQESEEPEERRAD